jgi:hypothetical protein
VKPRKPKKHKPGDVREDGRIFKCYQYNYHYEKYYEVWQTELSIAFSKKNQKLWRAKNRDKALASLAAWKARGRKPKDHDYSAKSKIQVP